jgi:hypothetical protein
MTAAGQPRLGLGEPEPMAVSGGLSCRHQTFRQSPDTDGVMQRFGGCRRAPRGGWLVKSDPPTTGFNIGRVDRSG